MGISHPPAFAMLHADGDPCVQSVSHSVVGAIVNWAAAHGGILPRMPDEEVWSIYQKYCADGGPCRLAAVTITALPGEIRSVTGGRGDA